jgi:hypothetical protein
VNIISKALVLAAALVGARAASAAYVEYVIQGNSCVSATPGMTPYYNQYGPYNSSTTSPMTLACPIPFANHNYVSGYIQVSGYTRNTSDPVFCNYAGTDNLGNNRSLIQAKVPYNGGSGNIGGASLYLSSPTAFLYVTCHLPVATASGPSYLSSIYVSANY